MKSVACITVFLSAMASLVAQDAKLETLTSLSYYRIAQIVLESEEMRLMVEVSPHQRTEIAEMLSAPELERHLNERELASAKRILELGGGPKRAGLAEWEFENGMSSGQGNRARLLATLDDVLEPKLRRILQPEQMKALRPAALRMQFPNGLSPFRDPVPLFESMPLDPSVAGGGPGGLRFLVPSIDARLRLTPQFAQLEKSRQAKLEQLRLTLAAEFIRKLPLTTRHRFVQTIGNQLTPEIPVDDSISYQSLPTRDLWNGSTLSDHVLHVQGVKQKLKITAEQLARIRLIHQDYERRLMDGLRRHTATDAYHNQLNLSVATELTNVLSDEQLLAFARHDAFWMWVADCRRPFARQEFVDFLKLSEHEAKAIRSSAEKQHARYLAGALLVEQEAFKLATAILPDESRERLERVFGKTWPPANPNAVH